MSTRNDHQKCLEVETISSNEYHNKTIENGKDSMHVQMVGPKGLWKRWELITSWNSPVPREGTTAFLHPPLDVHVNQNAPHKDQPSCK